MAYERLLDKSWNPSEVDLKNSIEDSYSQWLRLHEFIANNYDLNKEVKFYSKNYGWTVRYRKGLKTLISCFPEKGAFSVLLVLGRKEAEGVAQIRDELNENILSVFNNTEQLHDGRWLWIRILNEEDLSSVIKLLVIKRKPKNTD